MKFLRDIFAKTMNRAEKNGRSMPNGKTSGAEAASTIEALKRRNGGPSPDQAGNGTPGAGSQKPASSVNIWELEGEAPTKAKADAPDDAAPRRRQNRTKTRMLNFEPMDAPASDLLAAPAPAASDGEKVPVAMFPTGWLLVIDGPGLGASFPLNQGMSQIGRGTDQTVCLDFGDTAISRAYHAAIAFDPASQKFHIGHGGKSNIVRLNDKPLLSTEEIVEGDKLQIGETILLLKVLCNASFNWDTLKAKGDTDAVALA